MSDNIYKEGGFLDLWSVPHFLSGVVIGLPLLQYGYGLWPAAFIVLIVSIMFEVVELAFGVEEAFPNRITDVVLATGAYFCAYYSFITRDGAINEALLVVTSVLFILIVIPGWILYRRRKKEEAR